ncbi:type IV pilin-like G/H family protein [Phormidium sp. CLA17]|uniref:type IV pilin-like G/H family protein n=1 Tax=Leptolyngbya sp. Cla-17 TaxID=2803751 RepID=UPI0014908BAD|nr:type IV pilin-like G/H family protein [Leptolyngbya sp. Cla-17]MBM0740084.1 type IV pilin-like G/H family protein [Leptolyngbya sp. Cla-17]
MYKNQFALLIAIAAVTMTGCSTNTTSKASSLIIDTSTRERQAKSSVDSTLFNQQTYFLEKKAFASSFDALKDADSINTKDYSYRIVLKPDKFKGVAVVATSKNPKLRSYTGVVYVVKSKQAGNVTLSQLCETREPSKVAPSAPTSPKRASDKIRCPAGSRSAFELLA